MTFVYSNIASECSASDIWKNILISQMIFACCNTGGVFRASDILEWILISQMTFAHCNTDSESSASNSQQTYSDQLNTCSNIASKSIYNLRKY